MCVCDVLCDGKMCFAREYEKRRGREGKGREGKGKDGKTEEEVVCEGRYVFESGRSLNRKVYTD
jgi:hypothetical protein